MSDVSPDEARSTTAFWRRPPAQTVLAASAILAVGLVVGGFLLGDGLTRARAADRSVTVRGLAEKDVMDDRLFSFSRRHGFGASQRRPRHRGDPRVLR